MRILLSVFLLSVLSCSFTGEENNPVHVGNVKIIQQEPDEPHTNSYCWLDKYNESNSIKKRIPVPVGYQRVKTDEGSFGSWLRYVELKEGTPQVHLYNGELKGNQDAQFAVINMDVGNRDLQQCADAVMRMRAEYLFSKKMYDKIHFNYTSGDKVAFSDWIRGRKPQVKGNTVVFTQGSASEPTHANFRKYMDNIFNYCGTLSLSKEMKGIALKDIGPGDVFIFGGSPGHAVLVMDVALNEKTGDKVFLIAQSYMPAQEMHVLKNPNNSDLSPWYSVSEITDKLSTPEWTFYPNELKRFE